MRQSKYHRDIPNDMKINNTPEPDWDSREYDGLDDGDLSEKQKAQDKEAMRILKLVSTDEGGDPVKIMGEHGGKLIDWAHEKSDWQDQCVCWQPDEHECLEWYSLCEHFLGCCMKVYENEEETETEYQCRNALLEQRHQILIDRGWYHAHDMGGSNWERELVNGSHICLGGKEGLGGGFDEILCSPVGEVHLELLCDSGQLIVLNCAEVLGLERTGGWNVACGKETLTRFLEFIGGTFNLKPLENDSLESKPLENEPLENDSLESE